MSQVSGTIDGPDMITGSQEDKDAWHGVTDAKARKKIQDRLAQRARRRRLREAASLQKSSLPPVLCNQEDVIQPPMTEPEVRHDAQYLAPLSLDEQRQQANQVVADMDQTHLSHRSSDCENSQAVMSITIGPSPATMLRGPLQIEVPNQLNAVSAWFINAQILGINACRDIPKRSPPCAPHVPESLQPTPTQLMVLHSPSLDAIPFPKFRNNLIDLLGITVDEDEFTRDIYLLPSIDIKPGGLPWDPDAWVFSGAFWDKYGYLFDDLPQFTQMG